MADESSEDPRGPEYGEANYIRKGRPMFGKIWTYEELMNAGRPAGFKRGPKMKDIETPANWPSDTVVDKGTWVFWLPEGWMQGVRTQPSSGKTLKCYFSPEGKRFWHKKDMEKYLGVKLETREPPPPKESDETYKPRVRYVTDPDAIPNWPDDDWFPKDFKAAYRQLPSGLHPIFIPPGVEGKFLYHKNMVAPYLAGDTAKSKLTDMDSSTTMANISAIAAEHPGQGRKRKREVAHYADATDYESQQLSVTVASGDEVTRIVDLLKVRRFPSSVELLRIDGAGEHRYAMAVRGFYFDKQSKHDGRPCYQKLQLIASDSPRLACSGLYMYWSEQKKRWEMGTLQPGKGCVAFCDRDCPRPVECVAPWRVLRENFGREPSSSSSVVSGSPAASSQDLASESLKTPSSGQGDSQPSAKSAKLSKEALASSDQKELPPAAKSSKKQKKQLEEKEKDSAKNASETVADGAQVEREKTKDASAKDGAKDASQKPAGDDAAKAANGAQDGEDTFLSSDGKKLKWDGVWHTHKIWSYEEIVSCSRRGDDLPGKPSHWPTDPNIAIYPGKWQDWLPADWGQCQRIDSSGTIVTQYISPEGKLAFKKNDVEKMCKKTLTAERVPEWRDWLPRDWKISSRQKGRQGNIVPCYISPNGTRFMTSRADVEKCIREGKVNQAGGILKIQGS
eukprot:TRINITY_DN34286_c0_g1_i1.p1 TRINITY_DN34286_c0_g1~~TRINITY_DN34286_c0_g1_i1.p1  ORF type:complete len:688 (+),score=101.35 TRINITY_DN34286_c0_g1_i1:36-2066(+)